MVPRAPELIAMAEKPLPPPPPGEVRPKSSTSSSPRNKPPTLRRVTAPEGSDMLSAFSNVPTSTLPLRPRPRSPFARGHSRSRSSGSLLRAPQMTRAHSSPVPAATTRFPLPRPASPLGPSGRHRSPMRRSSDESFSSFGNDLDIDQTISENSELEVTPRATTDFDSGTASPSPSSHHTFPRSKRRPASPLSQIQQGPFTPRSTLRTSTSSPSLANSHYNESYPSSYSLSSPSIPSTPTSIRSRSPSISSLETIPDSPDAEEEAENIAMLKAAADREEQNEEGAGRRLSLSSDSTGRMGRDKRKRWSVCGAERRGDLDLETIWEDGS
ncbi:MAG: hypothetical protein Q9164_004988 [Protoblastenia rupestris]